MFWLFFFSMPQKVIGGQHSRELMEEKTSQDYTEFLELEKNVLYRLGLIRGMDRFSP